MKELINVKMSVFFLVATPYYIKYIGLDLTWPWEFKSLGSLGLLLS